MLFDKKCSASLLPQPLPERGACGVGTLAVEQQREQVQQIPIKELFPFQEPPL